jgi:hypothetical protein
MEAWRENGRPCSFSHGARSASRCAPSNPGGHVSELPLRGLKLSDGAIKPPSVACILHTILERRASGAYPCTCPISLSEGREIRVSPS